MPKAVALDTNLIVRLLTNDDAPQAALAQKLLQSAETGKIRAVIPATVVQETVYVLESIYGETPETISPALISFLHLPGVSCPEAAWVTEALQWYRAKNSDFGDALLCAYARHHGLEVRTFDKGLIKKFKEVPAGEPS